MTEASAAGPVGLLVVGHGSRRAEANEVVHAVAAAMADRLPGWVVRPAFLELLSPTIAEGYAALVAAGCARVVAHPYFLFPGNHSTVDIPAALRAAEAEHGALPWTVTGPLDLDPRIVDVVLDRVMTAMEGS
jgi:sirohydrochlorin cobaltochelatase